LEEVRLFSGPRRRLIAALASVRCAILHVVDVERHGDRGEDGHDHDDHHQLHQGEALFVSCA